MEKYFETNKINGVTVVKFLFSELSMAEAEEFKEKLYSLVSDKDNMFMLDLSRCFFLPSVVLGVLINFAAKLHGSGGKAVFARPTSQVRTIFKVTHLERIFDIYSTEEEALKALE